MFQLSHTKIKLRSAEYEVEEPCKIGESGRIFRIALYEKLQDFPSEQTRPAPPRVPLNPVPSPVVPPPD